MILNDVRRSGVRRFVGVAAPDMSFHHRAPPTNDGEGVVRTEAIAVWDKGS